MKAVRFVCAVFVALPFSVAFVDVLVSRKRSGLNSSGEGENAVGSRRSEYKGICKAVPSGIYLCIVFMSVAQETEKLSLPLAKIL